MQMLNKLLTLANKQGSQLVKAKPSTQIRSQQLNTVLRTRKVQASARYLQHTSSSKRYFATSNEGEKGPAATEPQQQQPTENAYQPKEQTSPKYNRQKKDSHDNQKLNKDVIRQKNSYQRQNRNNYFESSKKSFLHPKSSSSGEEGSHDEGDYEYDSDYDSEDIELPPELQVNFNKHKLREFEHLSRLQLYRKSNELVEMLKSKAAPSDEKSIMDYMRTKMKHSAEVSPYHTQDIKSVISEALGQKKPKDVQENLKNLQENYEDKLEVQLLDSYTLGFKGNGENAFKAASGLDMVERMNRKAIRNFAEYERYFMKNLEKESEKFEEIDKMDQALTRLGFYKNLKNDLKILQETNDEEAIAQLEDRYQITEEKLEKIFEEMEEDEDFDEDEVIKEHREKYQEEQNKIEQLDFERVSPLLKDDKWMELKQRMSEGPIFDEYAITSSRQKLFEQDNKRVDKWNARRDFLDLKRHEAMQSTKEINYDGLSEEQVQEIQDKSKFYEVLIDRETQIDLISRNDKKVYDDNSNDYIDSDYSGSSDDEIPCRVPQIVENEEELIKTTESVIDAQLVFDGSEPEDLLEKHDQVQAYKALNHKIRIQIAALFKKVRAQFLIIKETQNKHEHVLAHLSNLVEGHSGPKASNYVSHERQIRRDRRQNDEEIRQNIDFLMQQRDYNTNTKDVVKFDHELKILSKQAILQRSNKKEINEIIDQFEFLFEQMREKKVKETHSTQARIFEYAALSDHKQLADSMLRELQQNVKTNVSPIDRDHLESYYNKCLKQDNINGVALIVNYAKTYDLNIDDWDLSASRAGLEFYLNHNPDMNKLMTFVKLYTYFYSCKTKHLQNKDISSLNDDKILELNEKIFRQHSDLVDMRSLFKYLVNKLDGRPLIDSISHEDELWNLCELFSQPAINRISKISATGDLNNSLDIQDIVRYVESHFDNPRSFERVYSLAQKYDGIDQNQFVSNMLGALRKYQAKNQGALPLSFSEKNVADKYLHWRASEKKYTDKTAELMLYLLKSNKMWDQLVDLCDNYPSMVTSNSQSDVRNYYFADALLQMPIDHNDYHYYELIQDAVFEGVNENEPNKIVSMTKAYFKDGSNEEAVSYFKKELANRQEQHQKREELLVNLYDSVYATIDNDKLTLEEFQSRYLQSIELSNRMLKEVYTVNQLQNIIKNKNFDEIEKLFNMYTVMKQERTLLMQNGATGEQYTYLHYDKPIKSLKHLSSTQMRELENLRERRQALQSMFAEKERQSIHEMIQTMEDQPFTLLQGANQITLKLIQEILGTMSDAEASDVLSRSNQILDAAIEKEESNASAFEQQDYLIKQRVQEHIEDMEEENVDEGIDEEFVEADLEMKGRLLINEQKRGIPDFVDLQGDKQSLYNYIHSMNGVSDPKTYDPEYLAHESHEFSIVVMKEQLLEAITNRKKDILPECLQIFNKIQNQQVSSKHINSIDEEKKDQHLQEIRQQDISNLNERIQQLGYLFDDSRSPIYSALKDMGKHTSLTKQSFLEYNSNINNLGEEALTCKDALLHQDRLNLIKKELLDYENVMNEVQDAATSLLKQTKTSRLSTRYKMVQDLNQKELSDHLGKRIEKLYKEFKDQQAKQAEQNGEMSMSYFEPTREQKISLMRDTLQIELGAPFTSPEAMFPAFYAQDLIQFGLNNNCAEAIRLGESVLSESDKTVSREISQAIKDWQMSNASAYRDAVRITGPIDNSRLYFKNDQDAAPVFSSYDDPYWQKFLADNSSRQNIWKTPSMMAWDHKPRGIISEIIDFDAAEKQARTANQQNPYVHIANLN